MVRPSVSKRSVTACTNRPRMPRKSESPRVAYPDAALEPERRVVYLDELDRRLRVRQDALRPPGLLEDDVVAASMSSWRPMRNVNCSRRVRLWS